MYAMFREAHTFNADISGWTIKSGADTRSMFKNAYEFQAAHDCTTLGGTADDGPPNLCFPRPCDGRTLNS